MDAREVGTLRVMTYNLRGLREEVDALVEVVRTARPDVLAVQEPPRGLTGRARLRRFAARTGLRVAVGGGGARTTALLVVPHRSVREAAGMRLPWRVGLTRRGVATARVDGVRVVVVHLGLRAAERARHVDLVTRRLLRGEDGPVVVAGDLNERPGGPSWHALGGAAGGLQDAATAGDADQPTYPADVPRLRIDVVLVDGRLPVLGAQVPDHAAVGVASDHRPLVVDVHLPEP
ncbi:endonuclease/exonuclease/phosphatase family protein [Cellulomonas wangsupingiae]|uniref:Endonuclease/exonuclease/phosphatase family protein n=1 Tax=Cellulomonas wangsupingiae TaxID=2968085 RepID=A0ABY5K1H8_9CELL|nr:endonuclease/exonuclease/phosphatase family protein [Cellulomonas wangsupingiae]MCC2335537.1 endonuclease/exonuclease/phosphatase family protein [Cellulomonas wangsupingiae]MCM0639933.1 endonuclease/exonuclease/phosphatase family protein [Cellulomonas wangsupingiae]UUI64292.1 endonuclease/exonuclease/phosphatase family protein [Cellulomonas wangsupingiae]